MFTSLRTTTGTLFTAVALVTYLAAPAFAQAGTAQPAANTTQTAAQAATPSTRTLTVPITGTTTQGGTFSGALALTSFAVQNGQIVALGTLTGILTTAAGTATSVITNVVLPVTVGQTSCQILHLDLGPLSLDLLGLQVNLNQIVLDITAQPGPGNLLGNLLCSVANLLNNPNGLVNLLDQILAAL